MKRLIWGTLGMLVFGMAIYLGSIQEPNKVVVQGNASWAKYYNSVKDLKADADLIIKGTVEKELPSWKQPTVNDNFIVFTDYKISVKKVLGKNKNKLDSLIITKQGGTIDNYTEIPPEPVQDLVENQEYILFLEFIPELNKYIILGDFPGQFKVQNGKAENISTIKGKELKYNEKDLELNIENN